MKKRAGLPAASMEEMRSRLLLEAITDYAIYMLDRDGVVNSWNAGAQRIFGYQIPEIIGRPVACLYTVEDVAADAPGMALAAAAKDGKFENEGWRRRKDGGCFWTHVVIDPIRDASGELLGFAEILRDIDEPKTSEVALQRSEAQFRLLVQNVTDYAIYMLDPEGYVTNWNTGAERIKGYRPAEIIGQHFSKFYTPEERDQRIPWIGLEVAAREGRFEKEGWRVRKDGSRFWANAVIDAIRDDDGRLIGFAKITRDITERKEMQNALEQAREAFFQSQKMEAVGRLTGGIAHDFNNLLAAILGSLELARKRLPVESRATPLVENAIQGAQRGAQLTRRLLAFARRQELDPEPVDVPSLVRGMAGLLQQSLGPTIVIENDFAAALAPALVDANQLETALLNLAVNARDAMPQGGRIVIAARVEEIAAEHAGELAPGRYVCLSVADTGEGMDEETLSHAMEPFFTTKGLGKGTGLGLPMVHGLAAQSGGKLILKSRKREGTAAELWLPVAEMAAISRAPKPASPPPGENVTGLVVLSVDDDGLVLMNTTAMLEDLGHTVLEAISAEQALEILRSGDKRVDLVITDHAMPRMTGAQLAAAIRAEWPDLPVVLATGYTELPPGADAGLAKLSKPFRQSDLAQTIAELFPVGHGAALVDEPS